MPFTLAHPAAVWPLKFLRTGMTIPLVIGSLSPDLASYIPDLHGLVSSHSLRGSLILDLPLGYGLFIFLIALRTSLVSPLWEPHRTFVLDQFNQCIATKSWWLTAIPALIIGSWTHLLWDSFTHENHFMVRNLPVLQQVITLDGDYQLHLYRFLQYGCSLAGIIFIIWWYRHSLCVTQSVQPGQGAGSIRKILLLAMVAIALGSGLVNALLMLPDIRSVYWFMSVALTTAMPLFGSLYLAAGFLWLGLEKRV